MKISTITNLTGRDFFCLFGIFFLGLAFLALILAFFGFFYAWILLVYILTASLFLIWTYWRNKNELKFNRHTFPIIVFFLLISFLLSFQSAPSVFTGRDQGSFSSAAILLSQNHKIQSTFPAQKEFFQIYGPGKALNFPGFDYDKNGNLIPHFQLGYVSYLAIFYSFFGLLGFAIANASAFFFFLVSFYFFSKRHLQKQNAKLLLILSATAFIFSWFLKYTLSENLALGLLWLAILALDRFLEKPQKLTLLVFLLAFGFLLFVRVEALAMIILAAIIIFKRLKNNRPDFFRKILDKKILVVLIFIAGLFVTSLFLNQAFYRSFTKGFLNAFSSKDNPSYNLTSFFAVPGYVMRVFWTYSLFPYFFLGILGIFRLARKKEWDIFWPALLALPAFIYLLFPSISLDHPWMLRRYLFAVFPILLFYSFVFIDRFIKKRRLAFFLIISLVLLNSLLSLPYFFAVENKNLLAQTEKISAEFGKEDLVLVDRLASGDPYSMISGPLATIFQKQAVYFFNPDDLSKINLSRFQKVYFIIGDENIDFYKSADFFPRIKPIKDYVFETEALAVNQIEKSHLPERIDLPLYQKNYVYGKIYQLDKN